MFRGEPIALWTIILGFLSFVGVQLLGLIITEIIEINFPLTTQAHFFLAYFGWIGFVMMGAQLQFFRAITGLRKYSPQPLRFFFHLFLLSGIFLMVYASYQKSDQLLTLGIITYGVGVLIHTYWIVKQSGSKYFKFPLDYLFVSNLFLATSLILLVLVTNGYDYSILDKLLIRHILSIGWISLALQGALVRILPMFVGQSIDRGSRPTLKLHFIYCATCSFIFSLSFIFENSFIIGFTGFLWFISWIWTINILRKSIVGKNLEYKQSLLFFVPGLLWFLCGSILGFYLTVQEKINPDINFRALHIHLSLLLGISLIMLGAMHRITTFQIYTLLYTGKRQSSVTLKQMLRLKRLTLSAILFNISIVYMIYGFVNNDFSHVGNGGLLILMSTIVYSSIIVQNVLHYVINKKDAIPFWLKSTETDHK